MKIGNHSTHPAADAFPLMPDDALQALADDIKSDGLMRPIVLLADDKHPEGRILDGRNRYLACLLAKVEPRFRMYDGPTDANSLALYVTRENLLRRDLDPVQRALCARRLCKLIRERKVRERVQRSLPIETTHAVDELMSGGTPELVRAVERGDVPMDAALEVAKLPADEQRKVLQGIAEPQQEKSVDTQPQVQANRSTAIELSPVDLAALRALVFAGEASPHGIVRAGAALVRKVVPGV
jgi:ParB-like chromosome segregation protein Spo0J